MESREAASVLEQDRFAWAVDAGARFVANVELVRASTQLNLGFRIALTFVP